MKAVYLYTSLFTLIGTTVAVSQNKTCIANDEVQGIAQRWLNAFATGGIGGLPEAVTHDVCVQIQENIGCSSNAKRAVQIHIYDEGAQNGSTIPYVQNYNELYKSISASAYGGGGVTNVTYEVLFTFHTCHRIALRWQESAITTAHVGYGRYGIDSRQ